MIFFDKKTLQDWEKKGIQEISIYLSKGGCAGWKIQVETTVLPGFDTKIVQDPLTIFVKSSEVETIQGSHITFTGKKWIFKNSNIHSHCGCGSSFSLKTNNPLHDKIAHMKLLMKQKREGAHI